MGFRQLAPGVILQQSRRIHRSRGSGRLAREFAGSRPQRDKWNPRTLDDHSGSDGFVGALINEHKASSVAVAPIAIVE